MTPREIIARALAESHGYNPNEMVLFQDGGYLPRWNGFAYRANDILAALGKAGFIVMQTRHMVPEEIAEAKRCIGERVGSPELKFFTPEELGIKPYTVSDEARREMEKIDRDNRSAQAGGVAAWKDTHYLGGSEALPQEQTLWRGTMKSKSIDGRNRKLFEDNPSLTFADCVSYFSEKHSSKRAKRLIEKAKKEYEVEGEVEFDDYGIVSESAEGGYVLGWLWVYDDEETE